MEIYDLRSDTITKPSEEMRKAIYNAECGDDVYMEDPTVNKIQEMAADITGKEKAIFVSSGTMGNLIPMMVLGRKTKQILLEEQSHIIHYEVGGVSSLAGLIPLPVKADKGILTKDIIKNYLNNQATYATTVNIVEIENTHNRHGGSVYPIEVLKELHDLTKSKNVHLHMDGARVFNASIASKVSVKEISSHTDSITFCLSKGLGAPMGAMICADKDFIDEAFRMRKLIGGGMRQIGLMAAAGIYALENNIPSLEEDHQKAKKIAKAILESGMGTLNLEDVETNIVITNTKKLSAEILPKLLEKGIKANSFGDYKIRFVTHRDISMKKIDEVCEIIKNLKI
ncbi:low specificity L-threonine aldolase [Brachyspira hyodysenteriae]|uniref:L-allo-threonine aldolase n=2 Tax=Brachyspira hyodysenteriae TaxID=159 RepID=A0A3B6VC20_BRAHW|nr:low specificity L-threonine aldolase [Brachyspira hyodysenteriae]ACN82921.1 L-allo-threonine aldolase [Brachyspira hyodysenteriae WA1]ANN62406.1 threonine aldolase [Brachyspira hyodysenteriae ATCC 27164]AUJ48666.1 threonine aldolase [Brachyspira hyodysenteriae]KLI15125.1 threonine aldolase [Brachyspira hyodysenteriae]KLI17650.1 threonine aldolase [Brachyspira hyodysenteriae]